MKRKSRKHVAFTLTEVSDFATYLATNVKRAYEENSNLWKTFHRMACDLCGERDFGDWNLDYIRKSHSGYPAFIDGGYSESFDRIRMPRETTEGREGFDHPNNLMRAFRQWEIVHAAYKRAGVSPGLFGLPDRSGFKADHDRLDELRKNFRTVRGQGERVQKKSIREEAKARLEKRISPHVELLKTKNALAQKGRTLKITVDNAVADSRAKDSKTIRAQAKMIEEQANRIKVLETAISANDQRITSLTSEVSELRRENSTLRSDAEAMERRLRREGIDIKEERIREAEVYMRPAIVEKSEPNPEVVKAFRGQASRPTSRHSAAWKKVELAAISSGMVEPKRRIA
jgi:regulator of replication initiation timing